MAMIRLGMGLPVFGKPAPVKVNPITRKPVPTSVSPLSKAKAPAALAPSSVVPIQAISASAPGVNRLLDLTIEDIQYRTHYLKRSVAEAAKAKKTGSHFAQTVLINGKGIDSCGSIECFISYLRELARLVPSEAAQAGKVIKFLEIAASPSPTEIDDIRVVDLLYGMYAEPEEPSKPQLVAGIPASTDEIARRVISGSPVFTEGPRLTIDSTAGLDRPVSSPLKLIGSPPEMKEFWGAYRASGRWSANRVKTHNTATILGVMLGDYPWPAPAGDFRSGFLVHFSTVSEFLKRFINSSAIQSAEDARDVLTLAIIDKFDALAGAVERSLKREAKKDKRRAIIKGVAALALGGLMTFALPLVAAMAFSAVQTGMDVATKISAAKGLVKIAKQFAATNDAFGKEVERLAMKIDAGAANAELLAPTGDLQEEAIKEAQAPAPTPAPVPAPAPQIVTAPAVTQGQIIYELVIEDQTVATSASLDELARIAAEQSRVGDRVVVLLNGAPVKYFTKTDAGLMQIPNENVAQFLAMSEDERRGVVSKAGAIAAAEAKGGGLPTWLLAIPVAIGVVMASK